jgi:hypothetical protein
MLKEIKKLLTESEFNEAIDLLIQYFPKEEAELLIYKNNFIDLENRIRKNIIDFQEYSRFRNMTLLSVLELIKLIEKKSTGYELNQFSWDKIEIKNNKIEIDGIRYDSKLEATWGVFFKLMKWNFAYKPIVISGWEPKFKLTTESHINKPYFVEIIERSKFDIKSRMDIGKATNFSANILILNEDPFFIDYRTDYLVNIIGYSSLPGITKNHKGEDDFEFCSSTVLNIYEEGLGIYNLCESTEADAVMEQTDNFCLKFWNEAKNIINQ